jgi:hypothetical protein
MDFKKYLPITLPVLFIGLKNKWLTAKEVISLVNENSEQLGCNENFLLNININDDEITILELLKQQIEEDNNDAQNIWQLAHLKAIEQSHSPIHDKLREIELQWSRFGYPEAWRDFIYYMPNEKVNTEDEVYRIFLTFLAEEYKKLTEKKSYQL